MSKDKFANEASDALLEIDAILQARGLRWTISIAEVQDPDTKDGAAGNNVAVWTPSMLAEFALGCGTCIGNARSVLWKLMDSLQNPDPEKKTVH